MQSPESHEWFLKSSCRNVERCLRRSSAHSIMTYYFTYFSFNEKFRFHIDHNFFLRNRQSKDFIQTLLSCSCLLIIMDHTVAVCWMRCEKVMGSCLRWLFLVRGLIFFYFTMKWSLKIEINFYNRTLKFFWKFIVQLLSSMKALLK